MIYILRYDIGTCTIGKSDDCSPLMIPPLPFELRVYLIAKWKKSHFLNIFLMNNVYLNQIQNRCYLQSQSHLNTFFQSDIEYGPTYTRVWPPGLKEGV